MLNTINDAYDWLFSQRNPIKDKELTRIKKCIKDLELYPKYPHILITGTNGKGSTAHFLKNILKHTGRHVGLFTSPFVELFNERIMINDRMISNAELMHYISILYQYSNNYKEVYNDTIPFFELVLLISLMFYKDRNIDIAIFECGIGGIWDATNVLDPILSIITNIGYDHQHILGNTLIEIASHKIGITRENRICLTTDKSTELIKLAEKKNTNLINISDNINVLKDSVIYKNKEYKLSLLGDYQAYNASLAIEASLLIDNTIPYDIISYALYETKIPGRMEIISQDPLIILDGAHNISAISELVKNITKYNKRIIILFSALKDKDYKEMLTILDDVTYKFHFTNIDDVRGVKPLEFSNYVTNYEIHNRLYDAINNIKIEEDELLLVTGSLHFISEYKKIKNK